MRFNFSIIILLSLFSCGESGRNESGSGSDNLASKSVLSHERVGELLNHIGPLTSEQMATFSNLTGNDISKLANKFGKKELNNKLAHLLKNNKNNANNLYLDVNKYLLKEAKDGYSDRRPNFFKLQKYSVKRFYRDRFFYKQ